MRAAVKGSCAATSATTSEPFASANPFSSTTCDFARGSGLLINDPQFLERIADAKGLGVSQLRKHRHREYGACRPLGYRQGPLLRREIGENLPVIRDRVVHVSADTILMERGAQCFAVVTDQHGQVCRERVRRGVYQTR